MIITDFNENEENLHEKENEKEKEENEEENKKKDLEIENEKIQQKKLNKYQQREERPIKPLTNINFMESENPFGLKRESSENISENQNLNLDVNNKNKPIEKKVLSSSRAINRTLANNKEKGKNKKKNISESEKEKEETIKTQEKTDLSHEEALVSNKYIEYDNRPCGGGSKNSAMYDFEKYDNALPPPQKKIR